MPDQSMSTSEKSGFIVMLSALFVFFTQASEVLSHHSDWSFTRTPAGWGEIFTIFASVVVAIGGALYTDPAKVLSLFRKP